MEGEEETEKGRRSIPSLAHALEEARARASQMHQDQASPPVADETHSHEALATPAYGSLLDLAPKAGGKAPRSVNKAERARLAVEADAARRILSGSGAKAASDLQESVDEMRLTLDECLAAVRECREMIRTLAARRDRNYF